MKKLLTTVAVLATLVTAAQAEESFPANNVEKGCVVLQVAMIARIEQANEMNAAACRKLKARIDEAGTNEKKLSSCVIVTMMTHNRMNGRGDLEPPPTQIGDAATKGCAMMIWDMTEERAEYILKHVKK